MADAAFTAKMFADISPLSIAFGAAVVSAEQTGRQISASIGNAANKIGASFNKIATDARQAFITAANGAEHAAGQTERAKDAWEGLQRAAAVAAIAGGFAVRSFVNEASNLEETMGMVDAVFAQQGGSVKRWAKEFAEASGRGQRGMLDMAGAAQAMLGPLLGGGDATARMSTSLAELAANLGSVHNAADADVMKALQGAIAGNAAAMRRYGVVMSDAAVAAFAHSRGLRGQINDLTDAQKVQIRYAFIMQQTASAQGAAQGSVESYSGAMRSLGAVATDVKSQLGSQLMPAFQAVAGGARAGLSVLRGAPSIFQGIVAWGTLAGTTMLGLVPVVGLLVKQWPLLSAGMLGIKAAGTSIVAAFSGIGKAMLAALVPALPAIAALAAALVGIVLLVGALRIAWDGNLGGMKTAVANLTEWLPKAFTAARVAIGSVWQGTVRYLGDAFTKTFGAAFEWVRKTFASLTGWFTEKFILATSIMQGESPEQAHAKLALSRSGGGIGDEIARGGKKLASNLADAWDYGLIVTDTAWDLGKDMFNDGADALVKSFQAGKLTFQELLKALGGKRLASAAARLGTKDKGETSAAEIDFSDVQTAAKEQIKAAREAMEIAQAQKEPVDTSKQEQAAALSQARANAAAWWNRDEGKKQLFQAQDLFAQLGSVAQTTATAMLTNMGTAGNIVSGITQGLLQGGPILAAVNAIVALVTEGDAFKAMIESFNNILVNLSNALNPLFDGLKPVVDAVGVIVDAVGGVIRTIMNALQPAFTILGQVLKPVADLVRAVLLVLQPIIAVIGLCVNLFTSVGLGVGLLAKVLEPLTAMLMWVGKAIADAVNWVIEGIAQIIEKLGGWIPFVGDDIVDFANSLRAGKVNTDQFSESYEDAAKRSTSAHEKESDALDDMNESLTNVPNAFKIALERFNAIVASEGGGAAYEASRTSSAATSGAYTRSSSGGNVSLQIRADDPQRLFAGVVREMELSNFRQYGTTSIGQPGGVRF